LIAVKLVCFEEKDWHQHSLTFSLRSIFSETIKALNLVVMFIAIKGRHLKQGDNHEIISCKVMT
jgi:hypothetical protein